MPDALDRILADLKRLDGSAVAGALDEENATKMAFAEFGTVDAPKRRTLTPTTDRLTPAIFRKITREVGDVLDGKGRGVTGREIVADVARDLAEEVQAAIDGNTPPPLAASTATSRMRRGKDTRTLVDSGDMLRSIGVESSDDPRHFERQGGK
jgi:hypothetical protein